jgi:hemerythrin-like domain-containing protein
MQNPVASLCAEHALIRVALQVLTGIRDHVLRGGAFPNADATVLLSFWREFYVGVHCRKEAELVFPAIAMLGSDQLAEAVGQLSLEQAEAEGLLQAMVFLWEPDAELSPSERQAFAEAATAFRSRVERLLAIEEEEAFPAAELCVPIDDRLAWLPAFATIEHGHQSLAAWSESLRALRHDWAG